MALLLLYVLDPVQTKAKVGWFVQFNNRNTPQVANTLHDRDLLCCNLSNSIMFGTEPTSCRLLHATLRSAGCIAWYYETVELLCNQLCLKQPA